MIKGLGGATQQPAYNIAVLLVIHGEVEGGEENTEAVIIAVEHASLDTAMAAKAEQREAQNQDVVNIPDNEHLSPQLNSDNSLTQDWNPGIVGQRDVLSTHATIGDEGIV